jgi:hypothetical protein
MIEARAGWEEVRNWNGRSFWVCGKQMLAACYLFGWLHLSLSQLTTSTLPLPLSLMLNGNDSSRPLAGSWSVRKAWCGFLPVLPSVAVRMILRVSVDDKLTAGERAEVRDSLEDLSIFISEHWRIHQSTHFCLAPPLMPAPFS